MNDTVTTSKGLLTITSISAPDAGGVVTYGYSYTLSGNLFHTGQGEVNPLTDTITMAVTDATTGNTDTMPDSIVISIVDDVPVFTIVNDGADSGTAVRISAPNPASITTYTSQFADWQYGADEAQATPTLSGVTGNASINSSSSTSLVIDLKDASNIVVGKLTLNADGTDSIQVFHRAPTLLTDVLLTSAVTASGPSLTKTINSSISGLVITITGSDGDSTLNEAADEVNPSAQSWAVKNNTIDKGESLTFSFNSAVERFSFVADGFTGSQDNSNVGLTVRVYYDAAKTIFEDFTVTVSEGGAVQVADLTGFGMTVGSTTYTSFYGVNVLSDNSQDNNDGFRLNSVTVSKFSSELPPDLDYSFTLNVVDGDGDVVTQSFSVHLDGDSSGGLVVEAIAGTSGADTLTGTVGNDYLIGGAGDDILIGGTGADVFKWSLSDQGSIGAPASDVVMDFTLGSGGDVLDLRDLLQGETAGTDAVAANNLSQYLHFTEIGGKAVLLVDHDASGTFAATQSITFDNMSKAQLESGLGLRAGATDVQIIQKLLDNGNLNNTP